MRLLVGITGASGVIYGVRLLEMLKDVGVETHLIISKAGEMSLAYELKLSIKELQKKADYHYPQHDVGASCASGSFLCDGMIVAPCSMRTLSELAHAISSNLLTRAGDVCLKERRKLVLLTRETPLNLAHIENMAKVTRMGGIIAPPVPAFYSNPKTLEDMIDHSLARVLDLFDLDSSKAVRWRA
ncbi:MAG: UbiX family flavin prenyltransferase [Pseudomonadota bacterium]